MGLGNNRDYVKTERKIKCRLDVLQARTNELVAEGLDTMLAYRQASAELNAGKLKAQLKAWVDPVLAHRRAMRKKNADMPLGDF